MSTQAGSRRQVIGRIVIACVPTLVLLLAGEVAARGYYYHQHHDTRYLLVPFGGIEIVGPPPEYSRAKGTHTKVDAYSGRTLTFTINGQGGRGREWVEAKPPGAVRILAVGGSTTFGQNSPDDATWPALLEVELRQQYGPAIEVLNGGQTAMRLDEVTSVLSKQWLRYQPDLVLYYEAYNNTPYTVFKNADLAISHFHRDSGIGRWTRQLYYRSLLYTYFLEKWHFYRAKHQALVPEVRHFQASLQRLAELLQSRGVRPVYVLQATKYDADPRVQDLDLTDERAIQAFIAGAAQENAQFLRDQIEALRVYGVQVFVEAVRRTAVAAHVPVIDARAAMTASSAAVPLFCDEVHLTDEGNRRLAQAIARQLNLAGGR